MKQICIHCGEKLIKGEFICPKCGTHQESTIPFERNCSIPELDEKNERKRMDNSGTKVSSNQGFGDNKHFEEEATERFNQSPFADNEANNTEAPIFAPGGANINSNNTDNPMFAPSSANINSNNTDTPMFAPGGANINPQPFDYNPATNGMQTQNPNNSRNQFPNISGKQEHQTDPSPKSKKSIIILGSLAGSFIAVAAIILIVFHPFSNESETTPSVNISSNSGEMAESVDFSNLNEASQGSGILSSTIPIGDETGIVDETVPAASSFEYSIDNSFGSDCYEMLNDTFSSYCNNSGLDETSADFIPTKCSSPEELSMCATYGDCNQYEVYVSSAHPETYTFISIDYMKVTDMTSSITLESDRNLVIDELTNLMIPFGAVNDLYSSYEINHTIASIMYDQMQGGNVCNVTIGKDIISFGYESANGFFVRIKPNCDFVDNDITDYVNAALDALKK